MINDLTEREFALLERLPLDPRRILKLKRVSDEPDAQGLIDKGLAERGDYATLFECRITASGQQMRRRFGLRPVLGALNMRALRKVGDAGGDGVVLDDYRMELACEDLLKLDAYVRICGHRAFITGVGVEALREIDLSKRSYEWLSRVHAAGAYRVVADVDDPDIVATSVRARLVKHEGDGCARVTSHGRACMRDYEARETRVAAATSSVMEVWNVRGTDGKVRALALRQSGKKLWFWELEGVRAVNGDGTQGEALLEGLRAAQRKYGVRRVSKRG